MADGLTACPPRTSGRRPAARAMRSRAAGRVARNEQNGVSKAQWPQGLPWPHGLSASDVRSNAGRTRDAIARSRAPRLRPGSDALSACRLAMPLVTVARTCRSRCVGFICEGETTQDSGNDTGALPSFTCFPGGWPACTVSELFLSSWFALEDTCWVLELAAKPRCAAASPVS